MTENKNTSSGLDGLFENARSEQPVMSLNDVNDLIKNPSAFQKKQSSNAWRWFGAFLLIGLSSFGIFYAYNNNNSSEEKGATITTASSDNSFSSESIVKSSEPVSDNTNKTSEVVEANEIKNTSSDNALAENSVEKKRTTSGAPEKVVSAPVKTESGTKSMTKHYAADVNLNFSSDNKKIKMIISPDNEIGELKINDELIAVENYKDYRSIIDEGLKLKNEKFNNDGAGNTSAGSMDASKRNVMNAMMKQLTDDGLIASDKPFDFTLTGKEIFLNNEKQPAETFEKYKGVYESITGEKLPAKYNLHIKR